MSTSRDDHLDAYLDVEERELRPMQANTGRKLLLRILRHWKPVVLGFAMILIGTLAALAEPRLFGYAIDDAIVPRRWERLVQLSWIYLFVVIARAVAAISQGYLFEVIGQRVTQDLRCMLLSHLQRLPMSELNRHPAGRLLTRVVNDVASLGEMFSGGIVTIFSNILMVTGILVWLLALDLKLGLIAASVFPVLLLASIHFSRKLKVSYREARSKLSALNAFLAENLLGMKVVHLFNRRDLHFSRFSRLNQWYADAQISTVKVFAVFQPTITLAAGASVALVIWFGGREAMGGSIKIGVLFAYFSYVLALFQPVRELADKWNVFLSGMASAERIFALLEWPVESAAGEMSVPARPLADLKGHIVFEDVWFAYQDENWVLKDFRLEILPGQKIGVVGHTGAGKSTLINLLMRFYEPRKGRILLDGRDLREYDRRSLRASFGIIQQDVFIFSGTFEENITFWGSSTGAESVLTQLGLSTQSFALQEKGSNLSMGERQVLAFARAQAAQPRIWILDEATSNMDSETEAVLHRSLASSLAGSAGSAGKTAILIAHRLATVRDADSIVVLHKGVVVEKGMHSELVALGGLYSRLYRYQEAEEEPCVLSMSEIGS